MLDGLCNQNYYVSETNRIWECSPYYRGALKVTKVKPIASDTFHECKKCFVKLGSFEIQTHLVARSIISNALWSVNIDSRLLLVNWRRSPTFLLCNDTRERNSPHVRLILCCITRQTRRSVSCIQAMYCILSSISKYKHKQLQHLIEWILVACPQNWSESSEPDKI